VRADKKAAYRDALTTKGIVRKMSIASAFLSRKIEEYEMLTQQTEDLRKRLGCKLGLSFDKDSYQMSVVGVFTGFHVHAALWSLLAISNLILKEEMLFVEMYGTDWQ